MPKKTLTISIISIIILALIGGGVFWYLKQGKQMANPPVVENNNPIGGKNNKLQGEEVNVGSENLELTTDGWLTYRNEEYGFEVKYPGDFQVQPLLGESYKGQEYPRIGTSVRNPNTDLGTHKDINIYIYDQGIITIGNDLSDSIAFDFSLVNNFNELQQSNDFFQGAFETVNNTKFLKIIDKKTHGGESIYYISQNKYNSKFIAFSTYLGGIDNAIDNKKQEIIYDIISTLVFTR